MHRNTPLPSHRVLTVATAVLAGRWLDAHTVEVSDEAVADRTGYSLRTVHLVWQELTEMGAATVGRPVDGARQLVVAEHLVWAAAAALAGVTA